MSGLSEAFSAVSGFASKISPALSLATNTMSMFNQASNATDEGRAMAQAAEYNAAIARRNQQISLQNVEAARDAAAADRQQQQRINMARQGALKANLFKNIGDLSGTPLLLLEEEAGQGSLEAQKITQAGEIRARGFQQQADTFSFQAQQDDFQAASARYQGRLASKSYQKKAQGTLLTGLSNFKNPFA